VSYTPALRIRRDRQPRLIGNVLSIAIFGVLAVTLLARGLMPGPSAVPQAPGVAVVKTVPSCAPDAVLPTDHC
jgi:hypothetical protein